MVMGPSISMAKNDAIYLYLWSGDAPRARGLVGNRYPGIDRLAGGQRVVARGAFDGAE